MSDTSPTVDLAALAESPTYLFARVESSLSAGDLDAAADAQRRLAHLGYYLRIGTLTPAPISAERLVAVDQVGRRRKGAQ